jgi:hypothetical protein
MSKPTQKNFEAIYCTKCNQIIRKGSVWEKCDCHTRWVGTPGVPDPKTLEFSDVLMPSYWHPCSVNLMFYP